MSQVHRYCQEGPVTVDISLIQWIESVTNVDGAPPPGVISPLAARVEDDRDDMRNPEYDEDLVADTRKALDGCWLYLDEIHAIQRLRGWHRARYGRVTVDAYWLARARNVLDNLTLSLEGECEEMLEEYGLSRVGPPPQFPVPPQWQPTPASVRRSSSRCRRRTPAASASGARRCGCETSATAFSTLPATTEAHAITPTARLAPSSLPDLTRPRPQRHALTFPRRPFSGCCWSSSAGAHPSRSHGAPSGVSCGLPGT